VNVVMNLQVPQNEGNVACFIPVRAKDLSTPLYIVPRKLQLNTNIMYS